MKKERKVPKVLVLNPILHSEFDKMDKEFLMRKFQGILEIEVESLDYGPASIESHYDGILAAPFVVKKVIEAEKRGFDAVIINCFLEPGIHAARENVDIHVVGPGEAAIHIALMVGEGFSIIDPGPRKYVSYIPPELVRRMGVTEHFISVRGAGVAVLDITKNFENTTKMISQQAKLAVEEDKADVIVLGCTGLIGLAPTLQEMVGVPVIDPTLAALFMAEALCRMELLPNRINYPKPPKKIRKLPLEMI